MKTITALFIGLILLTACSQKQIEVERVEMKSTIVYDSIESRMPILRIAADSKSNTIYAIAVNPDFMLIK